MKEITIITVAERYELARDFIREEVYHTMTRFGLTLVDLTLKRIGSTGSYYISMFFQK